MKLEELRREYYDMVDAFAADQRAGKIDSREVPISLEQFFELKIKEENESNKDLY